MTALIGSVRKIDNLDDRKQIVIQLDHLNEVQRLSFLNWAIQQAPVNRRSNGKNPIKVVQGKPGSHESPFPWGSSEQCYFDLMLGIQQHAVPVDLVLNELERRASKKLLVHG